MVGTQQFNLRWNNHTSNILQVFLEHLVSESLVDVTLSCQGRFIRAHKIILSACSPYFQEVFANHTDKHPIIILNGIKYEDLRAMIKFMYNGEIRIQEAQLDDLLAAAETLQVKGLSNVRSKYEKGEITSLNPVQNKAASTSKLTDPVTTTAAKKELPLNAIKAAVALFAPTATTTRAAPNTVTPVCSTPATTTTIATVVHKITTPSYRAVSAVPRVSGATFHAVGVGGKRGGSGNVVTLIPASTLIPIPDPTLKRHRGNPIVSRISTSCPSTTTTATTMTTATSVFASPTTTTAASAPQISSDNSSTLTIDPTSITFGADVHFDDTDDDTVVAVAAKVKAHDYDRTKEISKVTPIVDNAKSLPTSNNDDSSHSMKINAPRVNVTSAGFVEDTTSTTPTTMTSTRPSDSDSVKKSNDIETPRIRKRRKMSHTVNELARETVFASNGTVLLEPDEAVIRSMAKMKKMISPAETPTSENFTVDESTKIVNSQEPQKVRIKIQTKKSQPSLLIKDREKDPGKVPRSPNAFMIFANEWRRKLTIEYPTETNTQISVRLAMMWKGLSIQAKETYYRLAKKADEEHKRKYPSYYYGAKEARLRKTQKQDLTLAKCFLPCSKNTDSRRLVKVYVNGEERQTDYYTDTDSSYCDDDDDDDDDEEAANYKAVERTCNSDIERIDYSEETDDPAEPSDIAARRSVSPDKPNAPRQINK